MSDLRFSGAAVSALCFQRCIPRPHSPGPPGPVTALSTPLSSLLAWHRGPEVVTVCFSPLLAHMPRAHFAHPCGPCSLVRAFHVCRVLTLGELCPEIAKRNQGLYPEFWASSCFMIALPQHVAKDRNPGACQTIALCTAWSCVCPVQLPAFCFPPINATNPSPCPPCHALP